MSMEMFIHSIRGARCYQVEVTCANFARFTNNVANGWFYKDPKAVTGKCPAEYNKVNYHEARSMYTIETRVHHAGAADQTLSLV